MLLDLVAHFCSLTKNKMKAVTTANHAAGCVGGIVWGSWLRHHREMLRLSQDAFALEVLQRIRNALQVNRAEMIALHIHSMKACTGFEISRFEKGVRLPAHRYTHLSLLWVLLRLGAVISVEDANAWLESGSQGWLTAREQAALFSM